MIVLKLNKDGSCSGPCTCPTENISDIILSPFQRGRLMCIELCGLLHGCYTLAFLKTNYQLKDEDPNSLFQVILYPRKKSSLKNLHWLVYFDWSTALGKCLWVNPATPACGAKTPPSQTQPSFFGSLECLLNKALAIWRNALENFSDGLLQSLHIYSLEEREQFSKFIMFAF